jgi:hypothetical protein
LGDSSIFSLPLSLLFVGKSTTVDSALDDTSAKTPSSKALDAISRRRAKPKFLDDDPAEMTRGRRLALRLMKNKWYNPAAGDDNSDEDCDDVEDDINANLTSFEKPSLAKAWAYFEHVSLQRYFVYDSDDEDLPPNAGCCKRFYAGFVKADHILAQAEPGATVRKTRLYDPISTPHSQVSFLSPF